MFISSLIFTTFAVDIHLVPNRLQLSFILLLSNITFKFVVAQALPKVSYLTVLVNAHCPLAMTSQGKCQTLLCVAVVSG